jgi:hypothetical protein
MIRHAPYRVLWILKTIVAIVNIALFDLSAEYYRRGGEDLILATFVFIFLIIFTLLGFIESIRAVKEYET